MFRTSSRTAIAFALVGLVVSPALSGSPGLEAAKAEFEAVAANPTRLETFCAMMAAANQLGADETDEQIVAKYTAEFESNMSALGPEFESAWTAADDNKLSLEEGEEWSAALDALEAKCPQ